MATGSPGRALPPVEQGAADERRRSHDDTYQNGLLVWKKWRSDATQTVRVQHVYQQVRVGPGGQAVVASSVGGAGRGAGTSRGRAEHLSKTQ